MDINEFLAYKKETHEEIIIYDKKLQSLTEDFEGDPDLILKDQIYDKKNILLDLNLRHEVMLKYYCSFHCIEKLPLEEQKKVIDYFVGKEEFEQAAKVRDLMLSKKKQELIK